MSKPRIGPSQPNRSVDAIETFVRREDAEGGSRAVAGLERAVESQPDDHQLAIVTPETAKVTPATRSSR